MKIIYTYIFNVNKFNTIYRLIYTKSIYTCDILILHKFFNNSFHDELLHKKNCTILSGENRTPIFFYTIGAFSKNMLKKKYTVSILNRRLVSDLKNQQR